MESNPNDFPSRDLSPEYNPISEIFYCDFNQGMNGASNSSITPFQPSIKTFDVHFQPIRQKETSKLNKQSSNHFIVDWQLEEIISLAKSILND